MENYNKTNGTTLNQLKVLKIGQNSKSDTIVYTYEHLSGTHGPYSAYVPKGNLEKLGIKVGKMYRVRTAKVNGKYHWVSAVELRRETIVNEVPRNQEIDRRFFRINKTPKPLFYWNSTEAPNHNHSRRDIYFNPNSKVFREWKSQQGENRWQSGYPSLMRRTTL
jgi:hypothetical protein